MRKYIPDEQLDPITHVCKWFSIIGGGVLVMWWMFPWTIPVRFGRALFLALGLMGCASAPMTLEERLVEEVNYRVNRILPCGLEGAGKCHPLWPSMNEIREARNLECTGYVMGKAYALAALGIEPERLAAAVFQNGRRWHAILVLDGELALDNLAIGVQPFDSYARFDPVVLPVPWSVR